jgi:hypothetical protein
MKWKDGKLLHLNDVSVSGRTTTVTICFCIITIACPQVKTERAGYHYRIQRSIQFKESLSLVVDGAEMSRYSLPYFCVNDKESSEGWRIPTRMYGAILHGEFSAAYVFPAFLPGGTNVVIEVNTVQWFLAFVKVCVIHSISKTILKSMKRVRHLAHVRLGAVIC